MFLGKTMYLDRRCVGQKLGRGKFVICTYSFLYELLSKACILLIAKVRYHLFEHMFAQNCNFKSRIMGEFGIVTPYAPQICHLTSLTFESKDHISQRQWVARPEILSNEVVNSKILPAPYNQKHTSFYTVSDQTAST